MPEATAGTELLNLAEEFPPASNEAWEAVIQKDLKGADYEKKLVWRLDEGIAVRPYYRAEDLAGLEAQTSSAPGTLPFVRGDGGKWEIAQDWTPPADAIRADRLHDAGANAVQELAYALAEGVERISKLTGEGKSVDGSAASTDFVFAVGSYYFVEIAKLRAARLLWAQVVSAFNPKEEDACRMRLHARTARINKSVLDANTNLLRATTEALAAVIGGAQSLMVEPFGFDAHLALNIQRVIKEEAHLDQVRDAGGGSYYIESLTDALGREAWKLFQRIESEGGYSQALSSGSLAKAVAQSRAAKEKALSSRRRAMIGVNNYPNLTEKLPEAKAPAADDKASIPQFRLAEPFEKLRERTARYAKAKGAYPKVLLLQRGDVKMRTARANFCLNFFGCAGFEMVESEEPQPADIIVLCSSDPEYVAFAKDVCAAVKTPVAVAGNPKEQVEELKSLGVQGFVHVFSDALQTLTEWQNRLGMEA